MSETLILDAVDETGTIRVEAYTRGVLTPETRREVVAEMIKELHLCPAGGVTIIDAT